jgi:diguanylate cyclase (GGDEF)-like protein/PAS domain S-box-containing protein
MPAGPTRSLGATATEGPPQTTLRRAALVALACLAGAAIGALTAPTHTAAPLLWPPAAIALAAMLRWCGAMAPAALLGLIAQGMFAGSPPLPLLLQSLATVAGAGFSAWALAALGVRAGLPRRADAALFVIIGAGVGPAVSAALCILGLLASGSVAADAWLTSLAQRWGAEAVAVMSIAPLLLSSRAARGLVNGWRAIMGPALLLLATLATAGWAFHCLQVEPDASGAWLFVPDLLLAWMALRIDDQRWSSATLALLGLGAALAGAMGIGPFRFDAGLGSMAALWGYLCTLAVIVLLAQTLSAELRQDRARWRGALEAAGLGVAEWDLVAGRSMASPLWEQLAGPLRSKHPLEWLDVAHPLDHSNVAPLLSELLGPGDRRELAEALRLRDPSSQEWRWHELRCLVLDRDDGGVAKRLLCTLSDTHWRHTAEERQRMSVSLFQHLHEGLLVTDTQHQLLDANPAYCRLVGATREALCGQTAAPLEAQVLLRSGFDPARVQQDLATQGHWLGRVQCADALGRMLTLQLTVSTIPEPNGPVRFHVVTVADLTEQTQQQALLDRQARFDLLTGLPNQAEFRRHLDLALEASEREGFVLCIASLDLDLFKRFNALGGEAVADRLLTQVAQRLQTALRSAPQWSDVLARLSGDEFGLILRCSDAGEARLAAERILNVLRVPFDVAGLGEPQEITGSLGATLYPLDHSDAETLLRHASHALYRVKRSGRNNFQFFDTEKRLRNEARVLMLGRMQEALDAGELQLYYQPEVDMRTGRVIGVEALLRWNHPEQGLLGPSTFLPEVEATGLGVQIGDWVLAQALKQSAQWLAEGRQLQVSVNVSARHLQSRDFAQRLLELISRHAVPVGRHLTLEVLESAALADVDATRALINRLRVLGVKFALDDFGTGYANLNYLKQLPVDALKIDRSFVLQMLDDAQDRALIEGVLGLARHFGSQVFAEGVASTAHASALLAMGCEIGQGSGIADAMPAEAISPWIERFERMPILAPGTSAPMPL